MDPKPIHAGRTCQRSMHRKRRALAAFFFAVGAAAGPVIAQPDPVPGGPVPAPGAIPDGAPKDGGAMATPVPGATLKLDLATRTIEIPAMVPIDCHDPKRPRVFLEVCLCLLDTKEHESLALTMVKPSQVHAAMLAAGFKPGHPVTWSEKEGKVIAAPPEGEAVKVEFAWKDEKGEERTASPLEWIKNVKTGKSASEMGAGFVFAGSVMVKRPSGKERYDADADGTLVGLASFGSETIAWNRVFNPDSQTDEPVWIADAEKVPRTGTQITVRISPANEPKAEPESNKPAKQQSSK